MTTAAAQEQNLALETEAQHLSLGLRINIPSNAPSEYVTEAHRANSALEALDVIKVAVDKYGPPQNALNPEDAPALTLAKSQQMKSSVELILDTKELVLQMYPQAVQTDDPSDQIAEAQVKIHAVAKSFIIHDPRFKNPQPGANYLPEKDSYTQAEVGAAMLRLRKIGKNLKSINHDLKTPLTVIYGFSQLIPRRLQKDGSAIIDVAKTINGSYGKINQLLALVDESVEGRYPMDEISIGQLRDLLAESAETFHQAYLDKAQPQVNLPSIDQVPQAIRNRSFSWARVEVNRLLSNLLDNSRKIGAKNVKVEYQSQELDGQEYCVVVVEDDGVGLPIEIAGSKKYPANFSRWSNQQAKSDQGHGVGMFELTERLDLFYGITIIPENIVNEQGQVKGARHLIKIPLAP